MSSTQDSNSSIGVLVDISLASLALIFGWNYVIYKFGKNIVDTNFDKILEAKHVSISDLRSFASESVNKHTNPLVVVRGMIKPLSSNARPILSQHTGLEGVLLQKIETSRLDICNRWWLSTLIPRSTVKTVERIPFVLVQNVKSDSPPSVVVNMSSCGWNHVDLTKVCKYLQPTITTMFGMEFSGVKRVQEEMLLVEKEINVFGNLFISKDGTVEIRACKDIYYFVEESGQLGVMFNLLVAKFICWCGKGIFGSLLLGVMVLILIRNRKRLRRVYLLLKYSLLKRLRQQGTD